MAHVETHINKVDSWPSAWPCGKQVEDPISLRHHLSDEYGLWKAEWKNFGRQRASEEDKDIVDMAPSLTPEYAGQERSYKARKGAKSGDKFIEWSPSRETESPEPATLRRGRPDKTKSS